MVYKDFKSYVQDNYYDLLVAAIKDYVDVHHDGIGFRSINVLSLAEYRIENMEVKSLACHEEGIRGLLRIDARVAADIVEVSLRQKEIKEGIKHRRFIVYLTAELNQGLHDVKVCNTEEYYNKNFELEETLDAYLIPYIRTDDLEKLADEFFEKFCCGAIYDAWKFPYAYVMQKMGIVALETTLPDNVFGRTFFKPTTVKYWYKAMRKAPKIEIEKLVPAGTIVINKEHHFLGKYGSVLNTIAHELVHWSLHQKFFEILSLLDDDANQLSCEVVPQIPKENMSGVQKAIWWAEWQANNLAPRIIMPRNLFLSVLQECYDANFEPVFYVGEHLETALEKVAMCFDVSMYEAKVRAIQLGIMEAEGVCLFLDKNYVRPIAFPRYALSKNQTFAIGHNSYEALLASDEEFSKLISNGEFVFAECFVVLNDPLYVKSVINLYGKPSLELTDYARNHANECCLVFERHYKSDGKYDYEYYGQCYLSKELTDSILIEIKPTRDLSNQKLEDRAKTVYKLKQEGSSFMEIMRALPSSFSGTFDAHMKMVKKSDGKKMTNIQMSQETGLSEGYIAKLRKKELTNIKLETVCALCIGLHLAPCFSMDMINKAHTGFALDEDGYFQRRILETLYTEPLCDINEVLKEAGIKPWGNF